MIESNAPRQETLTEARYVPKRRPLFDVLEDPCDGWQTRRLERKVKFDEPPTWEIELIRESDGAAVTFEADTIYVAWARATELAHMLNIGIHSRPIEPVPGVYSPDQFTKGNGHG